VVASLMGSVSDFGSYLLWGGQGGEDPRRSVDARGARDRKGVERGALRERGAGASGRADARLAADGGRPRFGGRPAGTRATGNGVPWRGAAPTFSGVSSATADFAPRGRPLSARLAMGVPGGQGGAALAPGGRADRVGYW
jgi:hypothetical protein